MNLFETLLLFHSGGSSREDPARGQRSPVHPSRSQPPLSSPPQSPQWNPPEDLWWNGDPHRVPHGGPTRQIWSCTCQVCNSHQHRSLPLGSNNLHMLEAKLTRTQRRSADFAWLLGSEAIPSSMWTQDSRVACFSMQREIPLNRSQFAKTHNHKDRTATNLVQPQRIWPAIHEDEQNFQNFPKSRVHGLRGPGLGGWVPGWPCWNAWRQWHGSKARTFEELDSYSHSSGRRGHRAKGGSLQKVAGIREECQPGQPIHFSWSHVAMKLRDMQRTIHISPRPPWWPWSGGIFETCYTGLCVQGPHNSSQNSGPSFSGKTLLPMPWAGSRPATTPSQHLAKSLMRGSCAVCASAQTQTPRP